MNVFNSLVSVLTEHVELDSKPTFSIAFSGGVDSLVLLHLMSCVRDRYGASLLALHVDHGIDPHSSEWENQCAETCKSWGIPFRSVRLDQLDTSKRVPENTARAARYDWMKKSMEGSILLTAHHKNDQAETVLLNLMRGAGARGLSGIQYVRSFGECQLIRPMLDITKEQILEYATEHQLNYIQDPANADRNYDRNFLRHLVLPLLQERWESSVESISRSAHNLSDVRSILDETAAEDLYECESLGTALFSIASPLSLDQILDLGDARIINLLRYWIREHSIPEPSRKQLDSFISSALHSESVYAELDWSGYKLCLFQREIYLALNRKAPDNKQKVSWDLKEPLVFESEGIRLIPMSVVGYGISTELLPEIVSVGFRKGGERFRMPEARHSSKLKKLLQAHFIPPWERNILPLIYSGDELVAVVPWRISDGFLASEYGEGVDVQVEFF